MTLNSEARTRCNREDGCIRAFEDDTCGEEGQCSILLDIKASLAALPTCDLVERLKLEAQAHASEARTANATIYEIYQVISGATGEPGNWHGAQPVRDYVEKTAAHIQALTAERDGLVKTAQSDGWGAAYFATLDRATTAEARVKVLEAAIAEIADFDPDARISLDAVRLIRIAGAARRTALNPEGDGAKPGGV